MVGAELIVVKYMFGSQYLITAIGIAVRGVLKAVGVMPASPAIKVAHLGTQASLIPHRNLLGIRMQRHFAVVGINISTMAIGIKQITISSTCASGSRSGKSC
jgi:hypothetical protein